MISSEEVLRRLTIGEPVFCRGLMSAEPGEPPGGLDARSVALVRLVGSITAGSVGPLLGRRVSNALDAGLDFDEIVAALVALAPTLGIERIVAVAPDLARALGYDIDAALERLEEGAAPRVGGGLGAL
jgi:alkylhydroperoxidase/carboxymuconolactone decarboxylase family protein YurZ